MAFIFSKDNSAYNYLLDSAEDFPCGNNFAEILKFVGFKKIEIRPKFFGSSTIYIASK